MYRSSTSRKQTNCSKHCDRMARFSPIFPVRKPKSYDYNTFCVLTQQIDLYYLRARMLFQPTGMDDYKRIEHTKKQFELLGALFTIRPQLHIQNVFS